MDPETAESLSRQNSSESESSPTHSPKCSSLNNIQEQDDDKMILEDLNLVHVVTELLDDLINKVASNKEFIDKNQKIDHHLMINDEIRTSSPLKDSSLNLHDISPCSEDSGISKALNKEELKHDLIESNTLNGFDRHQQMNRNTSDMSELGQHTGHLSQLECDISKDSGIIDEGSGTHSMSYFSSFSNEVKYWLGLQSQTRGKILVIYLD